MEAQDIIQAGDVFANGFQELTVITVHDTDNVKVETLAGTTKRMTARELIKTGCKETGKKPVTA